MKISEYYKKALSVLMMICIIGCVSFTAFAEGREEELVPVIQKHEFEKELPCVPADADTAEALEPEDAEDPTEYGGLSETLAEEQQGDGDETDIAAIETVPESNEEQDPDAASTDYEELTGDLLPSWSLDIPENPPVAYGAKVVTLETAAAVDIEDLGDNVIYMTLKSDCVFEGTEDELPVRLCVDGVPVLSGENVVYGMVTSQGEDYSIVTLEFSENGWAAIASGSYALTISYDSFLG